METIKELVGSTAVRFSAASARSKTPRMNLSEGIRSIGILIAALGSVVCLSVDLSVIHSQPWVQYSVLAGSLGFLLVIIWLFFRFQSMTSDVEEAMSRSNIAFNNERSAREGLEREVVNISELERKRIGQDLHDEVAQNLVASIYALELLERRLARNSSPEAIQVRKIRELLDRTLVQIRRVTGGLYPVTLEEEGLESALRELCDGLSNFSKVHCQLNCPRQVVMPGPTTSVDLYRIAQEAMNNAIKHGHATQVVTTLCTLDDGTLKLTIGDNGVGMPLTPSHRGSGLRIMQYRARRIRATLNIHRRVVGGTMVEVALIKEQVAS